MDDDQKPVSSGDAILYIYGDVKKFVSSTAAILVPLYLIGQLVSMIF